METWDNVKAMECKAWANVKAIYQNFIIHVSGC
jgi:hypothetical protein